MKVFLLLLIVPCLVAGDTQCPDSNISCPDDKKCCEVNGQHSCCDIEDDVDKVHILEGKMKVYPGEELLALAEQYPNASVDVQHGLLGKCNFLSCKGQCCKDFCCEPGYSWKCCQESRCCPPQTICCPVGCCPKRQECCAGGCCAEGQRCCGRWCCKKKQQCGNTFNSCYGKGATFTPAFATVLILAAAVVMSRHL
ncbi:progranulin-like [Argiope bruennichi]|uniref:progranulin-like n=1 Tax=Argiope bruennichi TaxID=94029 RepID=UPI002494DD5B|nr:progranulin-like [Argiope bruennichi]